VGSGRQADDEQRAPDGALERLERSELVQAGAHRSSMVDRPSLLTRLLARFLFSNIRFSRRHIDRIRHLSAESTVVYVMQTRSTLDYLYFNFAFLLNGLPLARYANGTWSFWFRNLAGKLRAVGRFLRRRRLRKGEAGFVDTVRAGAGSLLFLERPARDETANRIYSDGHLHALVDLVQRQGGGGEGSGARRGGPLPDRPITLIPLLLLWEKRSESYHHNVFDEVFGSRQKPGVLRKGVHLVQNMWQSFIRAGAPTVVVGGGIDLRGFLAENPADFAPEQVEALRTYLSDEIERERTVVVGPPIKPPHRIRQEILDSAAVQHAVQTVARETHEFYPGKIKKRASKLLDEISANFSLVTIKFLSALMNPIFGALYEGFDIDAEGLERVREVAKSKRLIIVPSHKSHMDYLIISNVFYQHGLMPPHIAAGVNLSFWPLGPVFRSAGAFFLRRTFAGDVLYSAIFREYMTTVIREGFPVEFFIEGTRSRTGKLSRPRYGILTILVQAAVAREAEDMVIVPVSVGYERVVEGQSHSKELLGGEKAEESVAGVLKATKVLRTKHGRVYVEFEEPIDVDTYVAQHGLGPETSKEDFQRVVRRLGYEVIHRINACTTVTPSAIAATVLLNNPDDTTPEAQIMTEAGFLVSYLLAKDARMSNTINTALATRREVVGEDARRTTEHTPFEGYEPLAEELIAADSARRRLVRMNDAELGARLREVMLESLRLFKDNGHVKIREKDDALAFVVDDKSRPDLSYYRNNIVHFFVKDAVLASAVAVQPDEEIAEATLAAACLELSQLFKLEFSFAPSASFDAAFRESLALFSGMEWLHPAEREGYVRRPTRAAAGAEFLRALLLNWIESYWLVASELPALAEKPQDKKDFLRACLKRGRALYDEDQLLHFESLSRPTFENVVAMLEERGVIATVKEGTEKLLTVPEAARVDDAYRAIAATLEPYRRPQARSLQEPLRTETPTPPVPSLPPVENAQ
jgi:glycerol-3-phosphate O-acyltransferase